MVGLSMALKKGPYKFCEAVPLLCHLDLCVHLRVFSASGELSKVETGNNQYLHCERNRKGEGRKGRKKTLIVQCPDTNRKFRSPFPEPCACLYYAIINPKMPPIFHRLFITCEGYHSFLTSFRTKLFLVLTPAGFELVIGKEKKR